MNRGIMGLRAFAVVIAIVAAIDPVITSTRVSKPEIAVVSADSLHDSALATQVVHTLGTGFSVTPAPLASVDATVIVGERLPEAADELATPVFAVSIAHNTATVAIDSIIAPASAPIGGTIAVTARLRVSGARGRVVLATLRSSGIAVDQRERSVGSDDDTLSVPLTYLPTAAGLNGVRVTAGFKGDRASEQSADIAIDARTQRWSILFYDPRPSWMSTFARRGIETDSRFVVTSRVATSKNVSTDAGRPPALDEYSSVAAFDAVIIGAPDALTDREVGGLEQYLRRRGGTVVLLMDQRPTGPYQRLTSVTTWRDNGDGRATRIRPVGGDTANLRAATLMWPVQLPAAATALALTVPTKGDTNQAVPVVWRVPMGAGRVIVSGALDAWRFRDDSLSAFTTFWRTQLAAAANASPPPLDIRAASTVLRPGESTTVTVTCREIALGSLPAHATVTAQLRSATDSVIDAVRLWPEPSVGSFTGTVRAPTKSGVVRIVVSGGGHTAETAILVAQNVMRAAPDRRDYLAMWTRSRGGNSFTADRLPDLAAAIRQAVHPVARPVRWYPMRSPWWLLPFTLFLSIEWWWRRRRGQR